MIHVRELWVGSWLEGLEPRTAHRASALVEIVGGRLADAAIALTLFDRAHAEAEAAAEASSHRTCRRRDADPAWQRETELLSPADGQVEDLNVLHEQDIRAEARREVQRELWRGGSWPDAYVHRLPFLHARTFVTALAQLDRGLVALGKLDLDGAEDGIRSATSELERAVPSLRAIRNSIEHAEDRMQGLGRGGELLALAPIESGGIHAPEGGVLVADNLNGRCYGCTIDDGNFAEVEISVTMLHASHVAAQASMDVLPWREGSMRWQPYA